jgi:hypothetical protein
MRETALSCGLWAVSNDKSISAFQPLSISARTKSAPSHPVGSVCAPCAFALGFFLSQPGRIAMRPYDYSGGWRFRHEGDAPHRPYDFFSVSSVFSVVQNLFFASSRPVGSVYAPCAFAMGFGVCEPGRTAIRPYDYSGGWRFRHEGDAPHRPYDFFSGSLPLCVSVIGFLPFFASSRPCAFALRFSLFSTLSLRVSVLSSYLFFLFTFVSLRLCVDSFSFFKEMP